MKKNLRTSLFTIISLSTIFFISCMPSQKELEEEEQAEIQSYISENPNINFEQKESGLYYCEVTPGTGPSPSLYDTIYVSYTGNFLNGYVFDTNVGGNYFVYPFGEGWVIDGFDEGISYMKEGGEALFLIPSKLGYGPSGYNGIPGYKPLLFEVTLVKIGVSSK
ncbi:MAG TPA: FKBP-type peptidyl-prolyl cis-trans isomerase [Bacteroidales bacterium]|nr:FKBP-type peptidyl-prolyl cis-trans isomerase [Bacteroidales bacterium]